MSSPSRTSSGGSVRPSSARPSSSTKTPVDSEIPESEVRSRPSSAGSGRESVTSSIISTFPGGKRMDSLLKALYHERQAGGFFQKYIERSGNKVLFLQMDNLSVCYSKYYQYLLRQFHVSPIWFPIRIWKLIFIALFDKKSYFQHGCSWMLRSMGLATKFFVLLLFRCGSIASISGRMFRNTTCSSMLRS